MGAVAVVPRAGPFMNEITGPPRTGPVSTLRDSQNIARPPNLRPAIDRRQAPRTAKSPQAARSVAHLPELLSRTHRNRVRKLSPGNRNSDVHDQPDSHIGSLSAWLPEMAPAAMSTRVNICSDLVGDTGIEPVTSSV